MTVTPFELAPGIELGGDRLPVIGGPCVIEGTDWLVERGRAMAAMAERLDIPYVFKSSYDKANRSSLSGVRGLGLEQGLEILGELRERTGLPTLTDVHAPEHCAPAAQACDILQIPAFLCRQTDLLVAAGRTGRPVNVKKGQFVSPWDMRHAIDKVASTGNENVTGSCRPMDSSTMSAPHPRSCSTTPRTISSGAEAPAVSPTVCLPSSHARSICPASSMR